ncbi:hypothetical protein LOK49_LG02G01087 [Camellia lanceoleosa]|uniref:Uncharacterized protein n=1 Tax=Camellia lanceoleosa TaxID=1840588 RepID=A0ACC0IVV4_9ERIC|nr:hypothetical protein LOK49_LG02G01087 [Camellia lanceoleosa]
MFNDGIQGTVVVAQAGLLGTVRAQDRPLTDFMNQKIVVVGAGSAGLGVFDNAAQAVSRMAGTKAKILSFSYLIKMIGMGALLSGAHLISDGMSQVASECIGDITAEVGAAVVRATVAEELAEGHCDVEPRELRQMSKQLDQFNRDFSEQWQSDNDKVIKSKELMNEADTNALKNECKVREKEEKKIGNISQGRGGKTCSQIGNEGRGGSMLAEKMRELEMIDMNNLDHVLDMKEVLHNYSRLTCPVYLDIVDNFFVDMYSEFLIPKPSVTITNSSRRLDPLKF